MAGDTLKTGKDKLATPVAEVDEKSLHWYANECSNTKLQAIAKRELARRAGGAARPAAAPSQALTRTPGHAPLAIEGNFSDPAKATAALKEAADAFHLLSPAPMVGSLPEGCAIALALVRISPDDPHLYGVGGKMALDRTHLSQLATASGASTAFSRRTDDGSDPHYCAWTVKVRFRQFDGTWLSRQGSVEMDLREPYGAEYVDAVRKAKNADRDPAAQIGELRRFITRHAESKALNRAYAAIGIRRSYTKAELQRPFCVARVVFTGQSEDPVARAQFREGIMHSFLSSTDDAFGPEDRSAPMERQLLPPPPLREYSMPPTFDAEGEDSDDSEDTPPEQAQQQAQPAAGGDKSPVDPGAY
jgi:hypothetical protein